MLYLLWLWLVLKTADNSKGAILNMSHATCKRCCLSCRCTPSWICHVIVCGGVAGWLPLWKYSWFLMQMAAILNLSRDCVCRCCWLAAAVWSWTAGTGRGRTRESSNHQQFKTDCQFVIHPLGPSCDDSSFSPLKDSRIRKVIWQFFFRANSFSPRKGTFTKKMRFMQMMYPRKYTFGDALTHFCILHLVSKILNFPKFPQSYSLIFWSCKGYLNKPSENFVFFFFQKWLPRTQIKCCAKFVK